MNSEIFKMSFERSWNLTYSTLVITVLFFMVLIFLIRIPLSEISLFGVKFVKDTDKIKTKLRAKNIWLSKKIKKEKNVSLALFIMLVIIVFVNFFERKKNKEEKTVGVK